MKNRANLRKKLHRASHVLTIVFSLMALNGCGGNSLQSIDKKTALISISKEKVLTPRQSIELSYATTRGNDTQDVRANQIIEGIRFESPTTLKNSHEIHTLVANYSFKIINGSTLKLGIEPGVSGSYYEIDADSETFNTTIDGTFLSYGLNFESRLQITPHAELAAHLLVHYNVSTFDSLSSAGISIILNRPKKPDISVGYRILSTEHERRYPGADIILESRGLHLGFLF